MSAQHNISSILTDDQIKKLAEAFLRWKLPLDFQPDGGISFNFIVGHRPTGTNLLTLRQAEDMVAEIVESLR